MLNTFERIIIISHMLVYRCKTFFTKDGLIKLERKRIRVRKPKA